MRAVVAHGAGDFRLEQVADPELNGGAIVRVEAAGVCATDRMIHAGDSPWELDFPFVPGHELVGTVEAVDPHAATRWGVAVGDRVAPEVMVPCRECAMCRHDRTHLCRNGRRIGSSLPGGWAERVWLPPDASVWRVPDGLAPVEAVMAEPLACAIHAIERAAPRPEETLVVSGFGAIGAAAIAYVVAARPVASLLALVTSPERAELARELGAHDTIDVRAGDVRRALAEHFDGIGPDIIVELAGRTEAVDVALDAVAPGGRIVLYGVYRERASVDWNVVAEFKELEIRGGHLAPRSFGMALDLLASRRVDARKLVTASYRLDAVEHALNERRGGSQPTLKTILLPEPRVVATPDTE